MNLNDKIDRVNALTKKVNKKINHLNKKVRELGVEGNLENIYKKLTQLETKDITLQDNIDIVDGKTATNNSKIDAQVALLNTAITGINSRLDAIDLTLADHETRIAALESKKLIRKRNEG